MNLNGLFLNSEGYSLDQAGSEKHELKLLASGDGVEVMLQEIDAEITFDIYPSENDSIMEFFYVLDGQIQNYNEEGDTYNLSNGDYFYTKKLSEATLFKTLTKVKLLYISTLPIFHYLGESIMELHKINVEVDKKDQYTRLHSERVKDYALKIALECHLGRDKMAGLAIAALFHDVGKVFVTDDILFKAEDLTDEEYEIMKQHPLKSAEHVRKIKYIDVSEIVKQHHERLDGSGYPQGLTGNEICIEAKIIAVADVFDAMTSDRPYHKGVSASVAIEEITRYSEIQFDKEVVDAFIIALKKDLLIK